MVHIRLKFFLSNSKNITKSNDSILIKKPSQILQNSEYFKVYLNNRKNTKNYYFFKNFIILDRSIKELILF